MASTEFAYSPDAPEYAGIRAELARLFIVHKVDLKMADWSDQRIVAQVNDIAAALIGCGQVALQHGDRAWLERHRWAAEAFDRLLKDQRATMLNG